ncbi:MAG TPA: hypothetical protein VKS24_25010 [Bradyrhizobium sp.]|nr:hypothetical protein [Bradyrhizobium sp.]
MAETEKKPERKSRREAMYDHEDSKKRREASAQPKRAASGGDGEGVGKMTGTERSHAEMLMRHRNERRAMHGRHRAEHDAIDKEEGPKAHKKIAAHHRHRVEMDQMHGNHENELMAAEQAQPGSATAPEAVPTAAAA